MKSAEDTTIAEFSSTDNRRVEVERQDVPQRAYLLRCWWERRATMARGRVWRFSLEEVFGERRRRGFRNLKALVAFIRAELADDDEALSDEEGGYNV
jgi:hypothetical protein